MKTKTIAIAGFFMICLFTLTAMTTIQDSKTFEGIYDGHEDYGYNFVGMNADGEEFTMTFQDVDETVFKSVDLKSDALVGSKFTVMYITKIETVKDEDGNEDENEINTITGITKL